MVAPRSFSRPSLPELLELEPPDLGDGSVSRERYRHLVELLRYVQNRQGTLALDPVGAGRTTRELLQLILTVRPDWAAAEPGELPIAIFLDLIGVEFGLEPGAEEEPPIASPQAPEVPEPRSAWLVFAGLAALSIARRT